jgi:hypothetical protein
VSDQGIPPRLTAPAHSPPPPPGQQHVVRKPANGMPVLVSTVITEIRAPSWWCGHVRCRAGFQERACQPPTRIELEHWKADGGIFNLNGREDLVIRCSVSSRNQPCQAHTLESCWCRRRSEIAEAILRGSEVSAEPTCNMEEVDPARQGVLGGEVGFRGLNWGLGGRADVGEE